MNDIYTIYKQRDFTGRLRLASHHYAGQSYSKASEGYEMKGNVLLRSTLCTLYRLIKPGSTPKKYEKKDETPLRFGSAGPGFEPESVLYYQEKSYSVG